ncbi:MAG: DUF58 domain-containing protein [Bacillota bacterium]|nr:DUF58 domain-containing protein [Bacillota bacterium]
MKFCRTWLYLWKIYRTRVDCMKVIVLVLLVILVIVLQDRILRRTATRKLDYECRFSKQEAYEGEILYLQETVQNRKFLPVPWLKVDIHTSCWLDFAGTNSVVTQSGRRVSSSFVLGARKKVIRNWKVLCLKRGLFTIENVTFVWGDLLGTSNSSAAKSVKSSLMVYPSPVNLENILVPLNYLQGDTIVKRLIIDDPFLVSGIREYSGYDPMNRIHWQATAKAGRLMVKKNDFTSQHKIQVILNIQSSEYEFDEVFDKPMIELGIKVAATVFDRAHRLGIPISFNCNGCLYDTPDKTIQTDIEAGNQHFQRLMKILAMLELKKVVDFDNFISDFENRSGDSEIIVITSYINDNIFNAIRKIGRFRNNLKIFILDRCVSTKGIPGDMDVYILNGTEDYAINEKKH